MRRMQKGGEGSVGEAAESKQMLAHDAGGREGGREVYVGEAAESKQMHAHDAEGGREVGK